MKNYDKRAEENLLEMIRQEEQFNKKMMFLEKIIGYGASVVFMVMIFTGAYAVENIYLRIGLFIIGFIFLLFGISVALKLETEIGYYECAKCKYKYVPKYSAVYFAMHYGRTRFLKCPNCKKWSWNKKVLKK